MAAVSGSAVLLGQITVLVTARFAREPVSDLLRTVPPRRAGARVGLADGAVMTASAVAVAALASGGLRGPLALAAPALLALVVGLAHRGRADQLHPAGGERRAHPGQERGRPGRTRPALAIAALRRQADHGASVVMTTHDPEASAQADAEIALDEGRMSWRRRLERRLNRNERRLNRNERRLNGNERRLNRNERRLNGGEVRRSGR
ncbi:MAG: putative transport system permease protein [Nocardioidaceae bacterium]|nr:putative transport system permease protein [Nocardioidaceae bacterium]